MKKIIYTCILFLGSFTVQAQTISAGIKAGYNLARLGVSGPLADPVISNTWISSFHVGGFLRKPIGQKGALQVELLYSGKGCHFNYTASSDLHLHYLNLPVLLNFQLFRKVAFEVGPELGYLVGLEQRVYNKFDLGIDAGLRYDFSRTIGLGVRYNYGVANLTTYSFITGSNVLRNQALQVSLAYSLFK